MPDRPSARVQECFRRADACARRAQAADSEELRDYWDEQEARWIQVAAFSKFSERVAGFLQTGAPALETILQEEQAGLNALADVFRRVCAELNIDPQDAEGSRKVMQPLVAAAMAGVTDPELLYELAMWFVMQ